MKLSLKDRWDDITGDKYLEIKIGNYEACCVKKPYDSNDFLYVMQCGDGKDVYSDISGADYPLRTLSTLEEIEILNFAIEQFEVEKELDRKVM